jgi:replicative DNA helicase
MTKTIPHSESLERHVLCAIMLGRKDSRRTALDALQPEDFYADNRAEVFRTIKELDATGAAVDTPLLLETLKVRHAEKFSHLWDEVEQCAKLTPRGNTEDHCTYLRNLAASRSLIEACLRVAAEGYEGVDDPKDFLDRAGAAFTSAVSRREDGLKTVSIGEVVHRVYLEIGRRKTSPGGIVGLPTGLRDFDKVLGGLRPGKVYVFAGRPGMGKSALAQQCVRAVAGGGQRVLVFSLEMQPDELGERMMASEANLVASKLAAGQVTDDEIKRLVVHCGELAGLPVEFSRDSTVRVDGMRRLARASHGKKKLGLIVVDYMQLLKAETKRNGNREQEVSEISRGLKLLAMELNVPVIAVAQLNRNADTRGDKRPMLSELRESGAIEQDADVVIFLYRDDYYNSKSATPGTCELIIAKHRGGPTGTIEVHFNAPHTKFGDLYRG